MDAPPKPRYEQLQIGRYIIRRSLGGGRHGKGFLAFDPDLERPVAIEWLKPADADQPIAICTIDLNEARTVAVLDHPNIVRFHEASLRKDIPYLVFAYAQGTTLHDRLAKTGAMPVKMALPLTSAILAGVACGHAQGILHLDLSSHNIMLDAAGAPRVMDFALASHHGGGKAAEAGRSASPRHVPPEHFYAEPLTARTDVYALALILFEMLSGQSLAQMRRLSLAGDAMADSALDLAEVERLSLDPRLQAIIRRAVSYEHGRRFARAAEMKGAVDGLIAVSLLERMDRQQSFPALSNNLLEINQLTDENNHSNAGTLANIVLRDYAITNKLLQLANSSFYGSARDGVKTVSNAIKLLGMNTICTTCNDLVFFNALKNENRLLKDALISSFTSALIGRHFATRLQRHDLAEEAFICGMFYRLGKSLAIFYFEDALQEIRKLAEKHGLDEKEASARVFGISYGNLGVTVAERWKFPDTIRHSIQCLGPGKPPKPVKFVDLQQLIAAFSNELCELAANTPAEQGLSRLTAFSNRFSGIIFVSPTELVHLLDAAFKKMQAFSPLLGLELPNSRWVSGVGKFLAAMQPLVEPEPEKTEKV